MGVVLEVLDARDTDAGSVVQGRVLVDGETALAFLLQPDLEAAFWAFPDGDLVSTPDQLRLALNLVVRALLSLDLGASKDTKVGPDEFVLVQDAWRRGLTHGWGAGARQDRLQFEHLWKLVWPEQRSLRDPA